MLRIKLKTNLAGPEHTGRPGDVLSVDDKFGEELVKAGYAEPAPEQAAKAPTRPDVAPVETATAEPDVETAVTRRKGSKG